MLQSPAHSITKICVHHDPLKIATYHKSTNLYSLALSPIFSVPELRVGPIVDSTASWGHCRCFAQTICLVTTIANFWQSLLAGGKQVFLPGHPELSGRNKHMWLQNIGCSLTLPPFVSCRPMMANSGTMSCLLTCILTRGHWGQRSSLTSEWQHLVWILPQPLGVVEDDTMGYNSREDPDFLYLILPQQSVQAPRKPEENVKEIMHPWSLAYSIYLLQTWRQWGPCQSDWKADLLDGIFWNHSSSCLVRDNPFYLQEVRPGYKPRHLRICGIWLLGLPANMVPSVAIATHS